MIGVDSPQSGFGLGFVFLVRFSCSTPTFPSHKQHRSLVCQLNNKQWLSDNEKNPRKKLNKKNHVTMLSCEEPHRRN
eukprot:m.34812 g.34812  ORF g.34812 m.34812 type:complete len:77 (+) comp17041_c0_seq1:1083-1313(+)